MSNLPIPSPLTPTLPTPTLPSPALPTPTLNTITAASSDQALRQDIADIEQLLQPYDPWQLSTITEMLHQKFNHCWAVLLPKTSTLTQVNDKQQLEYDKSRKLETRNMQNKNTTKVVAYCLFNQVFEVAEVLRIGTHPHHQRRGYAHGLLTQLIEQMPDMEVEKILLEVRADNQPAIALYQQLGFTEIYRRADYYRGKTKCLERNEYMGKSDAQKRDNSKCDAVIMQYLL